MTQQNKEFIKWHEISASLTGWARIIAYSTLEEGSRDAKNKRLESVYEGRYEAGQKDGYVRGISAVDGSCSAGMYTKDVVNGKYLAFKPDG